MFAHFRIIIATIALVSVLAAAPASALDALQQAAATAATAREAYDAAAYDRAAALYLAAWQIAPSQVGLLYNAGRAAHLAGQLRAAIERYQQFLTIPERDKSVDAKIHGYLEEIRVRLAEEQVVAGDRALAAADAPTAVQAFREAVTALPDRVQWLPRLAQAEEAAGDRDAARMHWRLYLAKAAPDAAERALATRHLGDPDVGATAKPAVTPPRWPGWLGLGLGVATGATAVTLAVLASGRQTTLNGQLAQHDAAGLITGIAYPDAQTEHDAIGRQKTSALVVGCVGIALAGAGVAWLLTHGDAQVTVAPGPLSAALTARF